MELLCPEITFLISTASEIGITLRSLIDRNFSYSLEEIVPMIILLYNCESIFSSTNLWPSFPNHIPLIIQHTLLGLVFDYDHHLRFVLQTSPFLTYSNSLGCWFEVLFSF